MESDRYARARLLFEQSRYDLAGKEVLARLAEEPNDPDGYVLLAFCQNALNRPEARDTARRAVELAPDDDRAHFVVSLTAGKRRDYADAEAAVRRAIAINSWNAGYFGHLAALHALQYQWAAALAAADEGLAIDPEDHVCLNNRAVALTKLGRPAEAAATLAGALEKRPEDAFSHANRGWTLLHENEPAQALAHFREALRLDPTSAWAKEGMLEALRARSWFYRRVLQVFLWLSRFPPRVQFGILIGLVVLVHAADGLATAAPAAAPVINGVILAYAVFVAATWFAKHLRNALLAFDRDGRLVLDREEKWVAGVVVVAVAAVLVLAGYSVFGGYRFAAPAAVFVFLAAVHFASVFDIPAGRYRWRGAAASVVILGLFAWERAERFDLIAEFDAVRREAIAFDDRWDPQMKRLPTLPEGEQKAARLARQLELYEIDGRVRGWRERAERLNSWESALYFASLGGLILHTYLRVKARRAAID